MSGQQFDNRPKGITGSHPAATGSHPTAIVPATSTPSKITGSHPVATSGQSSTITGSHGTQIRGSASSISGSHGSSIHGTPANGGFNGYNSNPYSRGGGTTISLGGITAGGSSIIGGDIGVFIPNHGKPQIVGNVGGATVIGDRNSRTVIGGGVGFGSGNPGYNTGGSGIQGVHPGGGSYGYSGAHPNSGSAVSVAVGVTTVLGGRNNGTVIGAGVGYNSNSYDRYHSGGSGIQGVHPGGNSYYGGVGPVRAQSGVSWSVAGVTSIGGRDGFGAVGGSVGGYIPLGGPSSCAGPVFDPCFSRSPLGPISWNLSAIGLFGGHGAHGSSIFGSIGFGSISGCGSRPIFGCQTGPIYGTQGRPTYGMQPNGSYGTQPLATRGALPSGTQGSHPQEIRGSQTPSLAAPQRLAANQSSAAGGASGASPTSSEPPVYVPKTSGGPNWNPSESL